MSSIERFWVKREGTIHLTEEGFLPNPDDFYGDCGWNPDVSSFDKISEKFSCLALLGEPGIGKSTILSGLKGKFSDSLWVDLASYSSEPSLYREIFDSEKFKSWEKSTNTLEIFLDSLDECQLHIETVTSFICDQFGKYQRERLKLRIACRTAEWHPILETRLPALWSESNYGVYEMTPLRCMDVKKIAEENGVRDSNAFIEEIRNLSIVPLAVKPITLNLLLRLYKEKGSLPTSQIELYKKGCLSLCSENNVRRKPLKIRNLSNEQRLEIAEKIAAATIFCRRTTIYTEEDGGDEGDLKISEIVKRIDKQEKVSIQNIREAIECSGLFNGRAKNKMGWSHWSFAEFLAASYLEKNELNLKQIEDLFFQRTEDELPQITPQLQETAAWLAGLSSEFRDSLISVAPHVLLRNSVSLGQSERKKIIESLFFLVEGNKISTRGISLKSGKHLLRHAQIYAQLKPIIDNKKSNIFLRELSIEIADICNLKALNKVILKVALDKKENISLRCDAIGALKKNGNAKVKIQLKSILKHLENDDYDRLRGWVLSAVFPKHLSVDKLFKYITLPKKNNFLGMYQHFLSEGLANKIDISDIPIILKGIYKNDLINNHSTYIEELVNQFLIKAWEHLDNEEIFKAFCPLAIARWKIHHPLFKEVHKRNRQNDKKDLIVFDSEKRKNFIKKIIPYLKLNKLDPHILLYDERFLFKEDLPWLIEQLEEKSNSKYQAQWTKLIRYIFDWEDLEHIERVFEARLRNSVLKKETSFLFDSVSLSSPEAQKAKADYEKHQQWEQERELKKIKETPLNPPLPIIIQNKLDAFDRGDSNAWWHLNRIMMCNAVGKIEHDLTHKADISSFPAWEILDDTVHKHCISVANKYLFQADPNPKEWLNRKNRIYYPAMAGYRALYLLKKFHPKDLTVLPPWIWKKWTSIILGFTSISDDNEIEIERILISEAYKKNPLELIKILNLLINKENKSNGGAFIVDKISHCCDKKLINFLLDKIKKDGFRLKQDAFRQILGLIVSKDKKAIKFAFRYLKRNINLSSRCFDRCAQIAFILLTQVPQDAWNQLWEIIKKSPKFGERVFGMLANNEHSTGKLCNELSEQSLAEFYEWSVQQYPYGRKQADEENEVHFRTEIERAEFFRDELLRCLQGRGTKEAVLEMRRLAQKSPQRHWLKECVLEANKTRLERAWQGIKESELFSLTCNKRNRIIETEDQFLEVILDSLHQLNDEFQGVNQTAEYLWNKNNPKSEEILSMLIKRHLANDLKKQGIIVNREVEITPIEKPDLKLDAIKNDSNDEKTTLTVIIEIKGCYNKDLKTSMEKQLKMKYLQYRDYRYGLYLVGWFMCPRWSKNDYRWGNVPRWNFKEARNVFDSQAVQLSDDLIKIKSYVLDISAPIRKGKN